MIYPGGALESAQVRATGGATQTTQLGKVIGPSETTVSVNVSVANDGACTPVCRRTTLNKIAVTGFVMEFPGQMLMTERGSVAALTAVEMARFIKQRHHPCSLGIRRLRVGQRYSNCRTEMGRII